VRLRTPVLPKQGVPQEARALQVSDEVPWHRGRVRGAQPRGEEPGAIQGRRGAVREKGGSCRGSGEPFAGEAERDSRRSSSMKGQLRINHAGWGLSAFPRTPELEAQYAEYRAQLHSCD
jgi:hypothetical protein